jgi:ribosomal protein L40E
MGDSERDALDPDELKPNHGGESSESEPSAEHAPPAICIACGAAVPSDVELCRHCGSYQSRWKNTLRYWATVAGLLTLAASLLIYTITTLPVIRKMLAWKDDVDVLAFESSRRITLINSGDGDILVTHVVLSAEAPRFSSAESVEQLLPPKAVHSENVKRKEGKIAWVSCIDDDAWLRILGRAKPQADACFTIAVHYIKDAAYLGIREMLGEDLRTFPANASVQYYSFHNKEFRTKEFPAIGTIQRRLSPECTLPLQEPDTKRGGSPPDEIPHSEAPAGIRDRLDRTGRPAGCRRDGRDLDV